MKGNLTYEQADELLRTQVVGHLGCSEAGQTYVVPISYAYDGEYIYCHTHEGLKLRMMRKNPKVCFQVDELKHMASWKSVVAFGRFEELEKGKERDKAIRSLLNRSLPIISSATTHLGKEWPFTSDDIKDLEGIVFRISVDSKSGRFEEGPASPPIAG